MSCYHHLTIKERECLFKFQIEGLSIREIARRLNRSPSTISRELVRNPGEYSPSTAQGNYLLRRKRCVRKAVLSDKELNEIVRFFLTYLYWSPEQICERLRLEHKRCIVATSTIYRALDNGLLRDTARYYLRIKYKKLGKSSKKEKKCFQTMITQRPKEAELRSQPGHWEGDTVHGTTERCCLLTLVDRQSRYLLMGKLDCAEAEAVNASIISLLEGMPANTITFDQGTEFASAEQLEVETYFCHPHSPWERPTNENTNGLIRQFFPKRRSLAHVSDEEVSRVAAKLNLRPRKCLAWRSPYELLFNRLLHFS